MLDYKSVSRKWMECLLVQEIRRLVTSLARFIIAPCELLYIYIFFYLFIYLYISK